MDQKLICPKCNRSYSLNDKFCGKCGYDLSKIGNMLVFCPYCGKKLPEDVAFCPACGKKMGNNEPKISKLSVDINEKQNNMGLNKTVDSSRTTRKIPVNNLAETITTNTEANLKEQILPPVLDENDPTYGGLFSCNGLFNYKGRRSRKDYILMGIVSSLVGAFLMAIPKFGIVFCIIEIIVEFTNLGKRLHDINKSAKWALAIMICTFIAYLGFAIGLGPNGPTNLSITYPIGKIAVFFLAIAYIPRIYLLFKKGDAGFNKYGPDPLKAPSK